MTSFFVFRSNYFFISFPFSAMYRVNAQKAIDYEVVSRGKGIHIKGKCNKCG